MLILSAVLVWLFAILLAGITTQSTLNAQAYIATQSATVGLGDFFLALGMAFVLIYLLHHRSYFGSVVSVILAFLIFSGSAIYFGLELAFFLAAGLMLFERRQRSFISNNLYVLVATLFGAIPLGLAYANELIILILIAVSIYDIGGVFFTRFIPRMATKAVELDVPLLLLAPKATVSWKARPKLKDAVAMLGAGDIFLPAIFLTSVAFFQSIPIALSVLLGAVLGGVANTILASIIKTGIPAMPLLSVGMIIAYYLAI